MKLRVNLEIFTCIFVLGILNGFILSKIIVPMFGIKLMHCILIAWIFGVLNYLTFLYIYRKYSLLKENNKKLLKQLQIDKLTGLLNRGTFDNDMHDLSNCDIYSIIFIDIDDFRRFNNKYGHAVGDKVLRSVSKTIKNCIRGTDRAYRYGGEEIVIILRNCDKEDAFIIAEKIRNNVSSLDNSPYPQITISLGVSDYPGDGQNPHEVIEACDKALLCAKKDGKNRTCHSKANW